MRSVALVAIALLALSSGSQSSTGHTPSPTAGGSESPSASPTGNQSTSSYGLLLSAGNLEMITPAGKIAASAKVAAPSVHTCGQGTGAVLQPPVSATSDKVFFRAGHHVA